MITIDGSKGEGGGQILRTALALSMVTGRSFTVERLRAKRNKPGLMRQHLTAARAALEVCNGRAQGLELHSQRLVFEPGAPQAREYRFAVGSAGSACLVLQTVLPALLQLDGASEVLVEGGTHNPMAPPYEFLARSYLAQVARMGPVIEAKLHDHGFYPAGGGRIAVGISGCRTLQPLELIHGGEVLQREAKAIVAHISPNIGQRELDVVVQRLGWSPGELCIENVPGSRGPGNALLLTVAREHVTEVFSGFGEYGVRAERVARRVCDEARAYLAADVPVGLHLADQLLLPMALAGQGAFRTHALTRHSQTNIETIRRFLDISIAVEDVGPRQVVVRVGA